MMTVLHWKTDNGNGIEIGFSSVCKLFFLQSVFIS